MYWFSRTRKTNDLVSYFQIIVHTTFDITIIVINIVHPKG